MDIYVNVTIEPDLGCTVEWFFSRAQQTTSSMRPKITT